MVVSLERQRSIQNLAEMSKRRSVLPVATHVGDLEFLGVQLRAANLPDGRRIISSTALREILGVQSSGYVTRKSKEENIPEAVAFAAINDFIDEPTRARLGEKVEYLEAKKGAIKTGFDVMLIPAICGIWISANNSGKLTTKAAKSIAEQASTLLFAFASIGVAAWLDEATGYAKDKQAKEYNALLNKLVSPTVSDWEERFPKVFYDNICRLKRIEPERAGRYPQYFGRLTNSVIYNRMAPDLSDRLKDVTPKAKSGAPAARLHQSLTSDHGATALDRMIRRAVTVMELNSDWDDFLRDFNRIQPKYQALKKV